MKHHVRWYYSEKKRTVSSRSKNLFRTKIIGVRGASSGELHFGTSPLYYTVYYYKYTVWSVG